MERYFLNPITTGHIVRSVKLMKATAKPIIYIRLQIMPFLYNYQDLSKMMPKSLKNPLLKLAEQTWQSCLNRSLFSSVSLPKEIKAP